MMLVEATASGSGQQLMNDLISLGMENAAIHGSHVAGWLPVDVIETAAGLDSLQSLSTSLPPVRNDYPLHPGDAPTAPQGDKALRADIVRGTPHFLDGTGITIGVISDSYDMSDIVWPTDAADGIIAQAVDAAVAGGVGYYSAAGNQGRVSYESAFEENVEVLCIVTCDPITGLVGPAHDFDPTPPDPGAVCNPAPGDLAAADCNIDTLLNVTIPAGASITIVLQWDEPFGNVNTGDGPQSDLIIAILDNDLGTLVDIVGSDNVVNGNPVEILQFINNGTGQFVCPIYAILGIPCTPVNINGTIVVAYDEVDSPGPLPAPVIRSKPEIVAVDGVSTTFFSSQQVGDSLPDFFGTSAAAPHAAAVAALAMEANSSIPPWKIVNALKTTAIDMGAAGFDFDTGYGLIQADAAVAAVLAVTADPTGLGATAVSASQVDLAWTDNSNNETGFDVERSPKDAGTWVVVGSVATGISVFSDTGLASNTPYDYRVKATYNSGTDSGYSNTAFVTTFDGCPAGPYDIASGAWRMFSLPCNPSPPNKVTEVFSNLPGGQYNVTWVVYRYDAATGAYVQLLADSVMSEGVGYIVIVQTFTTVSISGFPFSPVIDIPLSANGVALRYNMLGANRNGFVSWPDVIIVDADDGDATYTLAQADPMSTGAFAGQHQCDLVGSTAEGLLPEHYADCIMSRKMYKWNGAVYLMYDGETLGMEGSLVPFNAFWVSAYRTGTEGIKLRIPTPSLPPPPGAATLEAASITTNGSKNKKPTATPWYIRLIAESEGKQDPGNVLGQMETSTNGQERHDLEETYPFDTRYLSILFTNPEFEQTDWGFTSDFRKLSKTPKGRWPFVVKASADVESVTLRWEGDTALFNKAYLLDVQSNKTIKANPDGSYTFDVTAEETPFVFILKK